MNTKLTLSIDKTVIAKAKKYAKQNETSISELVENYLKLLSQDVKHNMVEEPREKYSPLNKIAGIVKLPDDYDYKKELPKILWERYKKLK